MRMNQKWGDLGCATCGRRAEKHFLNCVSFQAELEQEIGKDYDCWRPGGVIFIWGERDEPG